ncbi:MAG: hypothetical protein HN366_04970 [Deltaproteobacteria bacterium]|nr:hypothetical protein [Deltaproteobacteria bacterium]
MDEKNRIRFYLWMHDWTGFDLAEKAGLSQPTVSNAAKRNRASPRTQKLIAAAFSVPKEEIFPNGTIELRDRKGGKGNEA